MKGDTRLFTKIQLHFFIPLQFSRKIDRIFTVSPPPPPYYYHLSQIAGSTRKDFGAQLENLNKDMFTMFSVDPQGYGKSFPLTRKWTMDYHKADAENAATIMKVCIWT